jgi:hypothetical protein
MKFDVRDTVCQLQWIMRIKWKSLRLLKKLCMSWQLTKEKVN